MKGLLSIFILFSIYSYAQEKVVFFNNGEEVFQRNIESFSIKDNLKKTEVFSKRFYKFIQFNNIAATRYQKWDNYPTQRFGVLGGLTYSF